MLRSIRTIVSNQSRLCLKQTCYTNTSAIGSNRCILNRHYLGLRHFHRTESPMHGDTHQLIDTYNQQIDTGLLDKKYAISDAVQDVPPPSEEFVSSLNDEDKRTLQLTRLEIESLNTTEQVTPVNITDDQWMFLISNCTNPNGRYNFLIHLRQLEVSDYGLAQEKAVKQQMHLERWEKYERSKAEGILATNKMLININDTYIDRHSNNNLRHAMLHGIPLLIDMGYFDDHRGPQAIKNLLNQISMVFGLNKIESEPFHLVLCNTVLSQWLPHHGHFEKYVQREQVPITITEKSYLDLYPREDLIYLSPDAFHTLHSFDPNKIYILGGIADVRKEQPHSLTKAKKDGIACYKLPLDTYIPGGRAGSAVLTMDQMLKILLHMKDAPMDWQNAFEQHVPLRKTVLGREQLNKWMMAKRLAYITVNN